MKNKERVKNIHRYSRQEKKGVVKIAWSALYFVIFPLLCFLLFSLWFSHDFRLDFFSCSIFSYFLMITLFLFRVFLYHTFSLILSFSIVFSRFSFFFTLDLIFLWIPFSSIHSTFFLWFASLDFFTYSLYHVGLSSLNVISRPLLPPTVSRLELLYLIHKMEWKRKIRSHGHTYRHCLAEHRDEWKQKTLGGARRKSREIL